MMKRNIVKMSLVATMLLTTGVYSAQIVGADVTDPNAPVPAWEPNTQFGFGGLNLENITVNMITAEGNDPIVDTFDPETGICPDMNTSDSYQSDVFSRIDPSTKLGYVTQKTYPISEPTGIKVINNDMEASNGKPYNCIMGSSYLGDSNTSDQDDTTFFLDDATPKPVICSSYAGSSKRLQLMLNENMVAGANPGEYGKHIDLVFNIDPNSDAGDHRYQVFQKVTNHTGMRLDGLKVEVLNANGGAIPSDLNISLGYDEHTKNDVLDQNDPNLWPEYEMAFYPPGLWGDGSKDHLEKGWFDLNASGYSVSGHNESTIETGNRLNGNYVEIYGNWLPEKWVGEGMHIDPKIVGVEPLLIAYWGTTPDQAGDANAEPAWYYGMHDNDGVETNFAPVLESTVAGWATDTTGTYVIDDIEDLPNLSLNYIVNVGAGVTDKIIIRFTPKVSVDQTPPSYFEDDGVTRIAPPTAYLESKGIATIIPEPTFVPGSTLTVGVADVDLNGDDGVIEYVDVNVTNDSGDVETITLEETAAYTGVFSATLATVVGDANVSQDDNMTVVEGTIVTVTYNDEDNGTAPDTVTASTTAYTPPVVVDPVDPTEPVPSSGGGGCTYNPNSKSFDMTFLMLMALGLLYPFRRRFIK